MTAIVELRKAVSSELRDEKADAGGVGEVAVSFGT